MGGTHFIGHSSSHACDVVRASEMGQTCFVEPNGTELRTKRGTQCRGGAGSDTCGLRTCGVIVPGPMVSRAYSAVGVVESGSDVPNAE